MIIDNLFENNKKTLNEVDPRNFDSDEDYYNALRGREEDDDFDPDAEDDWYDDQEEPESHYEKSLRVRGLGEEHGVGEARVGNRMSDISIGSPKIVHYKGKAVGEVGIDHEASPGNGQYYMKHYLSGKDMVGYDTKQEALAELKYMVQQMNESEQLDELSWKDIQRGAKKIGKGAQKFTKNVADTGAAIGGAARDVGGAIKQVGKTAIADPVSAAYGATKSGLNKAANVAANTYNDVKAGAQKVGGAVDTVAKDVGDAGTWAGNKIKQAGRGVANVAGGTAGGLGAVAGGATTGVGRAAAKGFNTGVKNVGGNAVNRLQTNVFTRKPAEIKKDIEDKTAEIEKLNAELKQASVPAQQAITPKYNKVGSMSGSINNATGQPYTQDELEDMRKAQINKTQAVDAIEKMKRAAPGIATSPNLGGMISPTAGAAGQPSQVSYGQGFTKPAAAKPAAPNFARTGFSGYAQATPAPKTPAAPNVPAAPAAPRVTTGGPTKAERDRLAKLTAAAAARQPVAETIKQVVKMMETVTTKSDVQRVKNYIDYHFGKDLTESTRITRNKLIGEVTQLAAIRRRKLAANLAQ